jgi:HAD superfamily hydrolase (TIGR01509 family)
MKAVLFDLDGTIIDTEPAAVLALKESFREWQLVLTEEDATFITGRTWEAAALFLSQKYPIPVPVAEAKSQIVKRYGELLEQELLTVPGSVHAVESLAEDFILGLVSGSYRRQILWPDGYLKAVELLGLEPTDCLVFEDSSAGIQSARNAGLWVVAVTSTNHFQQNLSLAHGHIKDLTAVSKRWVETFQKSIEKV